MTIKQLIKKLDAQKNTIVKARDTMREILEEYEQLADNSDEAIRDIEFAVDKLSETV